MPFRLVVFDFDGTLADTVDWFLQAWNRAAGRFDLRSVTAAELDGLRGSGHREILNFLRVPLWKLPAIALYMRRLAQEDVAQIRLFAGTPGLLRELGRSGVRLGLVSSNSEELVRQVMGDLSGLIEAYECGASMFGKPRRLRRVLRRLGVGSREAVYVGDETRDVEAARAVGMASAAVLWGYARAEAFPAQQPTFADPAELAAFLSQGAA